jgi:hypothetical protein
MIAPVRGTSEVSAMMSVDCFNRISPGQFMAMLVSRRHLARVDRRHLGIRGLQDLETGELFEIEECKLLSAAVRSDSHS